MDLPEKQSFQRKVWNWVKTAFLAVATLGMIFFWRRSSDERSRREAAEKTAARERERAEREKKIADEAQAKRILEAARHSAEKEKLRILHLRAERAALKGPASLVLELEERAAEGRLDDAYLDEVERFLRGET